MLTTTPKRNPADGVAVLPDWGATLGSLWVPILAGSPLEAPDGLKAPIALTIHPLRAERGSWAV